MNRVLYDIQQIIQNAIKEYFPNVLPEMLEENGKIYYMNGKNGTEDDEYVNNTDNLELCIVNSIIGLDPVIIKYIDSPVGTSLVRKTEEEFEKDNE